MLRCVKSARQVLADNLREWMGRHPDLNNRPKLALRAGVSERTIGYMQQPDKGNPTIDSIEAVAKAFSKPAWHLLIDSPHMEKYLLLDKILNTTAVPDAALGDAWDATKTNGTAIAFEPPPPPYAPAKKSRRRR